MYELMALQRPSHWALLANPSRLSYPVVLVDSNDGRVKRANLIFLIFDFIWAHDFTATISLAKKQGDGFIPVNSYCIKSGETQDQAHSFSTVLTDI